MKRSRTKRKIMYILEEWNGNYETEWKVTKQNGTKRNTEHILYKWNGTKRNGFERNGMKCNIEDIL